MRVVVVSVVNPASSGGRRPRLSTFAPRDTIQPRNQQLVVHELSEHAWFLRGWDELVSVHQVRAQDVELGKGGHLDVVLIDGSEHP